MGVAGRKDPLRFSLACLDFSFLFRGVQRGYFSFQRERSEIMKADEPLISAKELPCRSRFPFADHGSMSDSAIYHPSIGRTNTFKLERRDIINSIVG
jgi:hypothetical protein